MVTVAPLTAWEPASWRGLRAGHQPVWPDPEALEASLATLATAPPLIFAGEARDLQAALARVARGDAFLLQGGDCAETFAAFCPAAVRAKLKVLLQMAVVLTYGAQLPVVKVGRIAGQYAKPRSSATETVDGVSLPSYLGDAVNGLDVHARGAGARPAAPRARVPPVRGDAEPAAVVHARRVRRPADACTSGTRSSSPAALRDGATRSWRPRSRARCASCAPAASTSTTTRGSRRSASGPHTRRCCWSYEEALTRRDAADRGLVRLLGAHAVDRGTHARPRRRARALPARACATRSA